MAALGAAVHRYSRDKMVYVATNERLAEAELQSMQVCVGLGVDGGVSGGWVG